MSGKTEDLNWMYEGTKAIVHREDYLTGRKVDKNFELYSDTVKKEKEGGIEALPARSLISSQQSSGSKKSALDIGVVRNEDPLVAIKVKEDRVRREILDNPMRMKKLQKLVKSAFEKKMRKALKHEMKKEQKKKRRDSSSSDSSSASSEHEQATRQRRQSPPRRRRDQTPPSRQRRYTPDRRDDRTARRSPERKRSRSPRRRRSPSPVAERKRRRHDSSASPRDRKKASPSPTRTPSPSTSKGRKRSPSLSDSDDERKRTRFAGYGLVNVKKKDETTTVKKERSRSPSPPVRFPSLKPKPTVALPPRKKEKLSAEEMEKRRLEMLENADWREKQRGNNLKVYDEIERREADRDEKKAHEAADFIRPMLQNATESKSLEDRLRSNRKNVQRSHGHMESHFARKN